MLFKIRSRVIYHRPDWDPKLSLGDRHGTVVEISQREGSSNVQSLQSYEIYAILWDDSETIERWYSQHDTTLSLEVDPATFPAVES